MTDPTPPPSVDPDDGIRIADLRPDAPPTAAEWGLDAAIGATARAVRAATTAAEASSRIARAIGASPVGRIAGSAARKVTEPLAAEGAAVRDHLEDELPAAARELTAKVGPAAVEFIDPNALLATMDLNALLQYIDLDQLLANVDLDAILARIDMEAMLNRIDINAMVARIDINTIVDQVDIDKVIAGVDVEGLMSRTELGGIIAKSTTGVMGEALDAIRRQGVRLDNLIAAIVDRVFRREKRGITRLGPPLLVPVPALPAADEPADLAPESA